MLCEGICFSSWELGFSHSPWVQCMNTPGVFDFAHFFAGESTLQRAHLKGAIGINHQQQPGSILWSEVSWTSYHTPALLIPSSHPGNAGSPPASTSPKHFNLNQGPSKMLHLAPIPSFLACLIITFPGNPVSHLESETPRNQRAEDSLIVCLLLNLFFALQGRVGIGMLYLSAC